MNASNPIDSLRLSVLQALRETSNLELLQRMLELIEAEKSVDPIIGYATDQRPITLSQLEKQIDNMQEQYDRGEFVSLEVLEEESKSWV